MAWDLAIGAGASLLGGLFGGSQAANAQENAAASSNATQKYMYDTSRADQMPFLRNGTAASNQLAYLLGLGGQDMYGGRNIRAPKQGQSDPAWNAIWDNLVLNEKMPFATPEQVDALTQATTQRYLQQTGGQGTGQDVVDTSTYGSLLKPISRTDIEADPTYAMGAEFGLNEGRKGLERQAAAGGNLLSGATLKALTRYGNDYATQKAGDAVNRIGAQRQQQYSFLGGMSGAGQAASGQTQAAGTNYANNVSQTQLGLGNARGASSIAMGNALGNAGQQYMNYNYGNQLLQAMQNQNRGGAGGMAGNYWNNPNFYPMGGVGE